MITAIDKDDYEHVAQMTLALQTKYRHRIGRVPTRREADGGPGAES